MCEHGIGEDKKETIRIHLTVGPSVLSTNFINNNWAKYIYFFPHLLLKIHICFYIVLHIFFFLFFFFKVIFITIWSFLSFL